jgi:hypothetical protein
MKITIICEGRTEGVFKRHLKRFVDHRLGDKPKPKIDFFRCDGAIPGEDKLRRTVKTLLDTRSDAVIALTDVYPGFPGGAEDAKGQMRRWVGAEARFFPHVALHDFEAWLLPYWDRIQELAGKSAQPLGEPERVNHNRPPAHRLKLLFEAGKCRDSYSKPRDAARVLKDVDLMVSVKACPELKALINTILTLSGGDPIP